VGPGDHGARKGGKALIVRIGHEAARALDRYLRVRSRHAQAWRRELWLGMNNRGPMTAKGIYQMITRRSQQAGVDAEGRCRCPDRAGLASGKRTELRGRLRPVWFWC
jgi:integrase